MEYEHTPEMVGQTIDTLAGKLEVPATQLLQIYGKGVMIEGIVGLLVSLLAVCTGLILFYVMCKVNKKADWTTTEPDFYGVVTLITGISGTIICIFGLIHFLYQFQISALRIFAPDYYLLTEIFSKF